MGNWLSEWVQRFRLRYCATGPCSSQVSAGDGLMIFLPVSIQISWVCVPNRYSAQPFIIWEKTTETTGFAMYSDANRTNTKKQAKLKSLETFYSQNCLNTWLTIPSTWHPGADVTVTTGKVITRDIPTMILCCSVGLTRGMSVWAMCVNLCVWNNLTITA